MYRLRQRVPRLGLGTGLAFALCAPTALAQQSEIVSSVVDVSQRAASLHLEFADGEPLDIGFAEGTATLNGEILGTYTPGGASDRAWRALLEDMQSGAGQTLARRLAEWSPDLSGQLSESDVRLLRAIDEALDRTLAVSPGSPLQLPPDERVEAGVVGPAAGILGRDAEFLQAWAAAIENLGRAELAETEVHIGSDREVAAGESVADNLIVVDGRLWVAGHVRGHVVVLNGELALAEGSRVDGDIRTLDTRIEDGGAEVAGEFVDLRRRLERREERLRNRIRDQVRVEAERSNVSSRRRTPAYVRRLQAAGEGVLGTLVAFALLGALALAVSVFGGHRVRSVVGELSSNLRSSAIVGLAGGYAVVPVFLLGFAALTLTVVGILALPIWGVLFPLLVCLCFLGGFVAAAEYIGRWTLGLGWHRLKRFDADRPITAMLAGIATLLLPFVVGNIVSVLPFVGWTADLLFTVGGLACLASAITGFGAVLITRGGRVGSRWADDLAEDELADGEDWPPTEKTP